MGFLWWWLRRIPCLERDVRRLGTAMTVRLVRGKRIKRSYVRGFGRPVKPTRRSPMDQLWAPWRLAYVAPGPKPADDAGCFLCRGLAKTDDRANLIVLRSGHSAVVLNRFPYNNGHLLVAPLAHKGQLSELANDELLDLQLVVRRMIDVLAEAMRPDGYNVGLNLGRVAGAGLPGHLHWHLVPRWNGDTNFMPVVADVKVISQSLESLYDLVEPRLRVQR